MINTYCEMVSFLDGGLRDKCTLRKKGMLLEKSFTVYFLHGVSHEAVDSSKQLSCVS